MMVAKSRVKNGGYGVYATQPIREGELLEMAPFIEVPSHFIFGQPNLLQDYVFLSHCKPKHVLVVFGYGSMYNHSLTPNVYYRVNGHDRNRFMDYVALTNVRPGEELMINYGPGHQVNHKQLHKQAQNT